MGLPASIRAASRGPPRPSRPRSPTSRSLILAALITVYIVLGVLYESFIHPVTILSTLPSAGRGRGACRSWSAAPTLSVIAVIGIILLIGIVKKNGIMMVDFALEAERKRGEEPARRPFTRPACSVSGPS